MGDRCICLIVLTSQDVTYTFGIIKIKITGYVEFTNNNNYEQDQVNLQYSMFITRTSFKKDRIRQTIHGNLDGLEDEEEVDNKLAIDRFFGLAGAAVDSFCGDWENLLDVIMVIEILLVLLAKAVVER